MLIRGLGGEASLVHTVKKAQLKQLRLNHVHYRVLLLADGGRDSTQSHRAAVILFDTGLEHAPIHIIALRAAEIPKTRFPQRASFVYDFANCLPDACCTLLQCGPVVHRDEALDHRRVMLGQVRYTAHAAQVTLPPCSNPKMPRSPTLASRPHALDAALGKAPQIAQHRVHFLCGYLGVALLV